MAASSSNAGGDQSGARITRSLGLHEGDADSWGMFCPDSSPAFIGEADPGIDWCCPNCAVVLAQGVYEHQFLDLLFSLLRLRLDRGIAVARARPAVRWPASTDPAGTLPAWFIHRRR